MQPQYASQQVDINYQKGQINYGKSPYILQSPYKLSSSSINSQVSKNNAQYQSPVQNFQRSLLELTQYQQQLQYNQNLQAIQQSQQNQLQQMSFNNTPQTYASFQSPVKQDYVLFERQDPYQRFNGNGISQNKVNNIYQQYQLPFQTISQIQNRQPNVYQIATLNTNTISSQDRLNTKLTDYNQVRQNRQNNNGYINSDAQSINSAYNSRYTDQQDKSMYGYQINKQRQFMSPDQQSVRSQRKKIFSPISDKTLGSIESDITSFQKYRQGGITNRLTNSQQVEKERLFKSQTQNRFSTQQFNGGQSIMSSSIQNRLYTSESDKKRIFSPVTDYSKLSPLTKENNRIEEEEGIYKGNAIQTAIQPTPNVSNNYYNRYKYQEENFSSPKFQDFDQNGNDAFNQSDDLAEKFYEAQTNDRDQSSYESFNNQNMSSDGFQNFEYERTKEQISPEKNSALKYLQEERVKRQLDGEFKKKQELEQALAKRRKLFFQGVVGLFKHLLAIAKLFKQKPFYNKDLVNMQQYHSFGELRNSQNNQPQYYASPTSPRNVQQGFQRGKEYSFQLQNNQSQHFLERRQDSLFSKNLNNINTKNELLTSQSMKIGQEKSNSPIRQIYEAPPYPNNCTSSYSNIYPITYQTMMNYNHRYQDYSPNTKQNTLVEADSLENTIKKQQDRDFYKYQLQQMNAQQNQLYQLNLSPFQSQAITPQKNTSNRQSSQNFQNKTYQAQQNFIKTDDQDFKQLKYTSPASQLDKINRQLFTASSSTLKEETKQDQAKHQQQQFSRQYQSENKDLYDSIHRNVNEIVSKYFKPLSKEDKARSEKLETQSMHQLSSNYKSNYEYQNTRNTSQIQDKTWSPLFTQNSRGNNNSNHSIYSQPFEIQTIQTQPDSQQYKLFQEKPSLNPSYSKYITPETEKILQKWNTIGVGDVRNQIDQRNRNVNQQYEINSQTKMRTQQAEQRYQPYQQQQYFEFNTKQSFNPSLYQQENIQTQNNFISKQKNLNSTKHGFNNQNYVLLEKENENHSQSLLNQGFIQSNQQTLQNIQQLNTINNISNIDQQTRFDISIQEQNRIYQEAKMNSLEEFDSFEKDKDQNFNNEDNIIYDSSEMFELKNKGIQSRKKANNNFQESEVFQSLQSTQTDNILTPSCLNLPHQDVNNRKMQQELQSKSHQDLTLKSLLNIPKSLQKISQTTEDQKNQKTKSLLAFQVVSCILILILLYILLIK
ncbi:hypothetical protein ABPG72_009613 [Tetrahymena utriculariae]